MTHAQFMNKDKQALGYKLAFLRFLFDFANHLKSELHSLQAIVIIAKVN